MTQFTPVYGFPWPEETDAPDGSAQIHAGLLAVENELVADLAPLKATAASTRLATAFPTSGTLASTVYPNAKALLLQCWNGGAGGGGVPAAASGQSCASGAGAGGSYAQRVIANPGATLTVTVGAAGAGGASGNTTGLTGGQSSVLNGATVLCTPGAHNANQAGQGGSSNTAVGGIAAGGFNPSTSGGVGDIIIQGAVGGNSARYSATFALGGIGGSGALGGNGGSNNSSGAGAGLGGAAPGGGGGGAANTNGGAALAGAAGGAGLVLITPIY